MFYVTTERLIKKTGEVTEESRYFICNLKTGVDEISKVIRGHWEIENNMHWILDVAFREDECRKRSGNTAENFSIVRHLALNLLKSEGSKKSIRRKRNIAGWDETFLIKVLLNDGNIRN